MQTAMKKVDSKKIKEKTSKDDTNLLKKTTEEKLKKTVYSVSTPRNFVQNSSTADIYAQKKKNSVQTPSARAPKKIIGSTNKSNVSPMKDLLKSSPSTASQISGRKVKNISEPKVPNSAKSTNLKAAKDLPFVNVTVNSPIVKKKIITNKNDGNSSVIGGGSQKSLPMPKRNAEPGVERQRTKTRTLNENEAKILTPDVVDNNAEMFNLTKKLAAQPKGFYVAIGDSSEKLQNATKSSEDEISYEDDFESYESDFDSYHESQSEHDTNEDQSDRSTGRQGTGDSADENENQADDVVGKSGIEESRAKEGRDEENMLDSGNFDLRDSRSATKAKPAMEFILENGETDVRSSLTDEGFQDMSSAVSSIRTVHVDILDRPLFIDFTKAKINKRKKQLFEHLKQRAQDILSMVTLHEMSYSLFEMRPIPYDVYMATFGRSNYTQTAVQTFDDGVNNETQTDEIECTEKWTQHPIEFSYNDIYLKTQDRSRKYSNNAEDYITKFTFLLSNPKNDSLNNKINSDENYNTNPLRIFLEQKDGVGSADMLPYENYKAKLKNTDYNAKRLGRFLKKAENKLSHILGSNVGDIENAELAKPKYPFSKGYITLSGKTIADKKLSFLKNVKVTGVVFSETKRNFLLTIHRKCASLAQKCVLCLWDIGVARRDPLKTLIAIDDVSIGRFRGGADGFFVAALGDGSVHLWDLSEKPTWRPDVTSADTEAKLVDISIDQKSQTEVDREWNLKNSHIGFDSIFTQCLLLACAYTTSPVNLLSEDPLDRVVGLELAARTDLAHDAGVGRRVLGQVCILQRIGIIMVWSIIQVKLKATIDIGRAYWSKMKLEKSQTISLIEHLEMPRAESLEDLFLSSFNLNAAKKRLVTRKKEKSLRSQKLSRTKSAVKTDSDKPRSDVRNKVLPEHNWENGIICNDLKIMKLNDMDCYLVARNCGEVLCCTKNVGVVKVVRFAVTTDTSSVTSLDVSPHSLPYFLAATEAGTIHICSILESRVLLTLDCRNGPAPPTTEKYQVDQKGRYRGSATGPRGRSSCIQPNAGLAVKTVLWSHVNPCRITSLLRGGALMSWELVHSDIYARCAVEEAAIAATSAHNSLALVTAEGEVQVHRLTDDQHSEEYLHLLQKYFALL